MNLGSTTVVAEVDFGLYLTSDDGDLLLPRSTLDRAQIR
jgi:hypothetical protein